jgi:hypothetical protein
VSATPLARFVFSQRVEQLLLIRLQLGGQLAQPCKVDVVLNGKRMTSAGQRLERWTAPKMAMPPQADPHASTSSRTLQPRIEIAALFQLGLFCHFASFGS